MQSGVMSVFVKDVKQYVQASTLLVQGPTATLFTCAPSFEAAAIVLIFGSTEALLIDSAAAKT